MNDSVLRHIQNGVDEITVIRFYIASLNREVSGNSLLPLAYFHVYRIAYFIRLRQHALV